MFLYTMLKWKHERAVKRLSNLLIKKISQFLRIKLFKE